MPETGIDYNWYDNGAGSENFKRQIALDNAHYNKMISDRQQQRHAQFASMHEILIRLSRVISDYTKIYGGESSTMDLELANVKAKEVLREISERPCQF